LKYKRTPSTDDDRSKQPEKVKYFNSSVSSITNGAGYTREIKSRRGRGKKKTALSKKKAFFVSTLDFNLGQELVKCYTWSSFVWC